MATEQQDTTETIDTTNTVDSTVVESSQITETTEQQAAVLLQQAETARQEGFLSDDPEVALNAVGLPYIRKEYITCQYTLPLEVGVGAYVRTLGPNDTPKLTGSVPLTTEPVVEITENGFKTTDTEYFNLDYLLV